MRFSVGTLEINDVTRKAIRKEQGQKGAATRADAKTWVLDVLKAEIARITGGAGESVTTAQPEEAEQVQQAV
jgi:hypothetical protein